MHLSIPESFLVSVNYAEDILNKKTIRSLQEYNSDDGFTNKFINRKDIVIGVSLPTQRYERWVKEKEAMEAYAKEKGVTLKIENAEFDAAKQAEQVDNLISQGINALILVAIDVSTAGAIVERAKQAGVIVVPYEALIINAELDIFVGFDNLRAGEIQGQFLIKKVPRGNYIIMYADLPYDTYLKDGAIQYIQPLVIIGNVNIVANKSIKNWDPNIAFKVVEDALIASNNKVNAILAPNDGTAGAAILVLQIHGLEGKVVVTGQDAELPAVKRILQGTQAMTLFKDTRISAKKTIDTAMQLINGENILTERWMYNGKMHVPSILIAPVLVEKDNIKTILIDSGYYKIEDIQESPAVGEAGK